MLGSIASNQDAKKQGFFFLNIIVIKNRLLKIINKYNDILLYRL